MKCEKCGNEYPSHYYFTTTTVCNDCFNKMSTEEQKEYLDSNTSLVNINEMAYRVGFGRRLGAFLIDVAIMMIVVMIVFNSTGFFSSYMQFINEAQNYTSNPEALREIQEQFFAENISNFYFSNLLSLVYFSLEILIGASLGKLILGIQIASDDRKRAAYSKLAWRFSLKNGYVIFSVLWLVSGIYAFNYVVSIYSIVFFIGCFFALGAARKALHDKIAKTAIFYKNDIIEDKEEVTTI